MKRPEKKSGDKIISEIDQITCSLAPGDVALTSRKKSKPPVRKKNGLRKI